MRSGREHWAWILAVEVREGTLGGDGRGWGPAGNTGRGWSWLRSGREHWAWMVVVEVRHRTMWIADRSWTRRTRTRQESEAEGRSGRQERKAGAEGRSGRQAGGRRQEATLIKSNNPHLAGGETVYICLYTTNFRIFLHQFFRRHKNGVSTVFFPVKSARGSDEFRFLMDTASPGEWISMAIFLNGETMD